LMPYINENYSTYTDRAHTAVCGFSMGGRVSLHLGFAMQDTFRYVGAFCPAPGILDFTDNGKYPAMQIQDVMTHDHPFRNR
ncbi:alpha/beta hydrolase-fold protein, partial [Salmonella enterica]|uniref:alpha/beta hydrolase-fold protein n=1 Tax=Salmonella enterica TaxID=28901 RepID=UPI0020C200E6